MLARLLLSSVFLVAFSAASCFAAPGDDSGEPQGNPKSIELNEKGAIAAQSEDYKQAEQYFQQAYAADPNNLTAVFNLSGLYLRNKKPGAAITLLTDYTKKVKDDAGLYARLGDAYFGTKKVDKAIEAYEKALAIDPNYPKASEKIGALYTMNKRLADAEAAFLKAIELDPKNGQLLMNLSNVFLANQKPDKAVSTAKRGLQVKASSELYVTLGSAYEMLNDYKNSLIAYQRAVDLGDDSDELQDKISFLQESIEKVKS